MSKRRILALYENFDDMFAAVKEIRNDNLAGVHVDDLTLLSPVDNPEMDEALGGRPVNVQKFTFIGACFGVSFGFFFLSAAQASFLVQPQGGKPVIPFPSNFVLMYEMLIFFGIWTTVFAFLILAGLLRKRGSLYSEKITVDHTGIMLEVDDHKADNVKNFFNANKAVEIREEKA
jgi:hypothetical protein